MVFFIFVSLYPPATGTASVTFEKKLIGPCPDKLGRSFHADIVHHPQIKSSKFMEPLPLNQERIISIHKERVIELSLQSI